MDASFLATYNEGYFIISFGQYLGDISPYKVYLCAYDNARTLGWGTTVQYVAPIATDENYNMIFVFADNGTWAKQHVDGFYYGKFTGTLQIVHIRVAMVLLLTLLCKLILQKIRIKYF